MLIPLLIFLFGAAALGLVVAVLRDSRRRGYPAGYRRGRPLPAHPVQRLTPRPPRRPPLMQRGSGRPNLGPVPRTAAEPGPAISAPAREAARPTPPRREPAYAERGAAALEEAAPSTSMPAGATPTPPRRSADPSRPRTTPQLPPAIATGAAGAWSRTRETAATVASRSREAVVAAATSPQTKRATQTAREWMQRAAAATAYGAQRFSVFTREQFERDPRRAGIVAAVVGVGVMVILLFAVMALTGGGDDPPADGAGGSDGAQPSVTQPAGAPPSPAGETATPSPTATPQPLAGTPYSETSMTSALAARGITPTVLAEAYPCAGASTTPRTFEVTGQGGEQQYVLLVYTDSAGMNSDWVIGGGRPTYRGGACAANAETIYFNANVLMVLPETTSTALRSQVVDAFLAMQ